MNNEPDGLWACETITGIIQTGQRLILFMLMINRNQSAEINR